MEDPVYMMLAMFCFEGAIGEGRFCVWKDTFREDVPPTPGFLWDLGERKVKFRSKKAIFRLIWGGLSGLDLVWESARWIFFSRGLYYSLLKYNHIYKKLGLFYKKKLSSWPIFIKKNSASKFGDHFSVMFPALYQPCTTLYHQFGAFRTTYGLICPIYGILRLFLASKMMNFMEMRTFYKKLPLFIKKN